MKDMEVAVREDMDSKELRDEDVFRINEKIKDLEKQILNVVEGQKQQQFYYDITREKINLEI